MMWRITGPARQDLDDIWAYTASTWGVEQADRTIDSLTTRMLWLSENKKLWVVRDDIRSGIFSYHQARHVILFLGTSEIVSIVRVLHDRMDVMRPIASQMYDG